MSNDIPSVDSGESTIPELSTDGLDNYGNPDSKVDDMFAELFPEAAAEVEAPVEEVVEDEVSEEEAELSDDESHIETSDDADEDPEESEGDTPDHLTLDDLISEGMGIEIDGKVYSANDLKAMRGRVAKQEEAKNEVEAAKQELEERKAKFEQDEFSMQQQYVAQVGNQQLQKLQEDAGKLQEQMKAAANDNDSHRIAMLQVKYTELQQQAQGVQAQVQQAHQNLANAKAEAASQAVQELEQYGLGGLATDTKRAEAFKEYAFKNVPESVIGVVNTNSALLAMVEKARLYDKAQSTKATPKKRSAKSIKGSAAKSSPKKVDKSTIDSKIDSMFS